jgi:hypothetical protein
MARSEYDLDARAAEARERKRRDDAEILKGIYDRRAAENRRQYEADQRRERADQEAAEERRARQQSQAESLQRAQVAWAEKRDELQAEANELRRLLTSARGVVVTEPLADARLAAADVAIYEKRLDLAERVLATHRQAQPAGY